jgi:hypothetical protein
MKSNIAAKLLDYLSGILFGFWIAMSIVDLTSPDARRYITGFVIIGYLMVTILGIWLQRRSSRSTAT